jgi:hypothetical protein
MLKLIFLSVAHHPNSGPGRLIAEVCRSHTLDMQSVGLLWTSDQSVAEAATYTTHNKGKGRTFKPSSGFESAIPAVRRRQTYVLDRAVTGLVTFRDVHAVPRVGHSNTYSIGHQQK